MNINQALVLISLPIVAGVLSLLMIAIACVIKWRKSKSKITLAMMIGSVAGVFGPTLIVLSLLVKGPGEIEGGIRTIQVYWWENYLPYVLHFGFLLFAAAFLMDNLKKPNHAIHPTETSSVE